MTLNKMYRDTADHVEEGFDEAGDKIKAGAKAIGNKIKRS